MNIMNEEIVIYTKPTCPFSKKLRGLLDKENIKYKDINILGGKNLLGIHIDQDGHIPTPQVKLGENIIWKYSTEKSLVEDIKKYLKN